MIRASLGPLVVFALSCLVFAISARVVTVPPAWMTFEFCQYAEIGRNLALDGCYDTRVVEPMALATIDRDLVAGSTRPGYWPVVNRYPLPCFVIAALMRAFGTTAYVAAWSNGLAVSLLAATLFVAARSWLGTRWATVAALVWLANPSCYGEFILLGTPDVWFAALFFAQIFVWSQFDPVAVRLDPRPIRWRWAVGVGILGGLSYLARFNASVFLAVEILILGVWRRRWREALLVVVASLLVVAPSLLDTWRHFGRPTVSIYSTWNLLDRIGAYRVEPWLYYQIPDVGHELMTHAAGVGRKVVANLKLLAGWNGVWVLWRLDVLIPLSLVGLWLGGPRGSQFRRALELALGLFLLQSLLFAALRLEVGDRNSSHNGRYFFWFAPCAVLLGIGAIRRLAQRGCWWSRVAVVGLLGWQFGLLGLGWVQVCNRHLGQSTNLGTDPVRQMIAQMVQPNQVIASNQPHITAWFTNKRSISLPASLDDLVRLNTKSAASVDYLFVDSNFNTIELDSRWTALVMPERDGRSPWLPRLLQDYRFVLDPKLTRPLRYVILRRVGLAPSAVELQYAR